MNLMNMSIDTIVKALGKSEKSLQEIIIGTKKEFEDE